MTSNPTPTYPAVLLSPDCPDITVPPMLARDLLLHLRVTARIHVDAGRQSAADHVTSLADELERAVCGEATPCAMADADVLDRVELQR